MAARTSGGWWRHGTCRWPEASRERRVSSYLSFATSRPWCSMVGRLSTALVLTQELHHRRARCLTDACMAADQLCEVLRTVRTVLKVVFPSVIDPLGRLDSVQESEATTS